MLSFFVPGRPQPEPKREIAQTRSGRKYIYKRDPDGSKKRWMENVRLCARKAMHEQGIDMIKRGVAVGVQYDFYFEMPKSIANNYLAFNRGHVVKPDESNLIAAMDNALKGLCFYDDNQINQHIVEKTYASKHGAVGVAVIIYER